LACLFSVGLRWLNPLILIVLPVPGTGNGTRRLAGRKKFCAKSGKLFLDSSLPLQPTIGFFIPEFLNTVFMFYLYRHLQIPISLAMDGRGCQQRERIWLGWLFSVLDGATLKYTSRGTFFVLKRCTFSTAIL
jgi:hypothetical protein